MNKHLKIFLLGISIFQIIMLTQSSISTSQQFRVEGLAHGSIPADKISVRFSIEIEDENEEVAKTILSNLIDKVNRFYKKYLKIEFKFSSPEVSKIKDKSGKLLYKLKTNVKSTEIPIHLSDVLSKELDDLPIIEKKFKYIFNTNGVHNKIDEFIDNAVKEAMDKLYSMIRNKDNTFFKILNTKFIGKEPSILKLYSLKDEALVFNKPNMLIPEIKIYIDYLLKEIDNDLFGYNFGDKFIKNLSENDEENDEENEEENEEEPEELKKMKSFKKILQSTKDEEIPLEIKNDLKNFSYDDLFLNLSNEIKRKLKAFK